MKGVPPVEGLHAGRTSATPTGRRTRSTATAISRSVSRPRPGRRVIWRSRCRPGGGMPTKASCCRPRAGREEERDGNIAIKTVEIGGPSTRSRRAIRQPSEDLHLSPASRRRPGELRHDHPHDASPAGPIAGRWSKRRRADADAVLPRRPASAASTAAFSLVSSASWPARTSCSACEGDARLPTSRRRSPQAGRAVGGGFAIAQSVVQPSGSPAAATSTRPSADRPEPAQRPRPGVAAVVLPVEQHSRRSAARPGGEGQAARTGGARAAGQADARRPAVARPGRQLRRPVAGASAPATARRRSRTCSRSSTASCAGVQGRDRAASSTA